ncbi:DUF1217 domain-containing protein [Rhodobacterales bacterium HKCCE2091]|nr:DUF1217 domain-containing protein [Rhodobacterales bacterium HKCCE2091]
MTFQPIVPMTGYARWAFLERTLDDQTEAFSRSPVNARDMEYFRENIGLVVSAEELVSDYRLLRVALSAYGLQDDLPNRAFIRTVLSDGTTDDDALSNRLADKRYRAFSEAFGFGEVAIPKTQDSGFADRILARFERQEFERAVGEQSEEMRLGLTLQRELPEIAARDISNNAAWLSVMGNPPLREVFETALGLPEAFGLLDIDRQLETFQAKARQYLGTDDITEIASDEGTEKVLRNYFARAQINTLSQVATPASIALTLLQGGG